MDAQAVCELQGWGPNGCAGNVKRSQDRGGLPGSCRRRTRRSPGAASTRGRAAPRTVGSTTRARRPAQRHYRWTRLTRRGAQLAESSSRGGGPRRTVPRCRRPPSEPVRSGPRRDGCDGRRQVDRRRRAGPVVPAGRARAGRHLPPLRRERPGVAGPAAVRRRTHPARPEAHHRGAGRGHLRGRRDHRGGPGHPARARPGALHGAGAHPPLLRGRADARRCDARGARRRPGTSAGTGSGPRRSSRTPPGRRPEACTSTPPGGRSPRRCATSSTTWTRRGSPDPGYRTRCAARGKRSGRGRRATRGRAPRYLLGTSRRCPSTPPG